MSKTAGEFRLYLKKEGWQLARATKDDAITSQNRRMVSEKFKGTYHPELREGDYVAVNPRGKAFHLNERSTGRTFSEMKKFMSALDREFVNSVRAAENFAAHKISGIENGKARSSSRGWSRIGDLRNAGRAAGAALGLVGAGVSLLASFDRMLTPEQKVGRNLDDTKKKLAAQRVEQAKKIERPKDFERER